VHESKRKPNDIQIDRGPRELVSMTAVLQPNQFLSLGQHEVPLPPHCYQHSIGLKVSHAGCDG